MDKFKEKRKSLERFSREQIIGPGAFNKRFFLLEKWHTNEFQGKLLHDCLPLDNGSEIISEVPAYQYSSGILFPISKLASEDTPKLQDKISNPNNEEDDLKVSSKLDDEELTDEQYDSISSRNQNYPNTCGLAFAVDESADLDTDLTASIKYRTYTKVKQNISEEQLLGYWVSEYEKPIQEIFEKYFLDTFECKWVDNNLFIILKKGVNINEVLYSLDYINLENVLQDIIIPIVNKIFPDNKYFQKTKRNYQGSEFHFTSFLEEKIIEEVKTKLQKNKNSYNTYRDVIQAIEIYNRVKEIVLELKTIYRESSMKNHPTPIWESKSFTSLIKLPVFSSSKNVQRGEIKIDDATNIVARYQYIRYTNSFSGKKCIYIKLVLVNTNLVKIKDDEPPQLNKKDEANKKSFFGVEINIQEANENIIQPYNPPNLLDIDQEDNFNKLIYRQYKDYGEGYNTSVNWSRNNNLIWLSTEFLPDQDTPKIDFRPSKNSNGNIIPRIDESILSFRYLSTLSNTTDIAIIDKLDIFIDEYYEWIKEKENALNDPSFTDNKELLIQQLRACEADYKRLKRNISLLATDHIAMTAFRLMNTAMFMQLHHSIMVKGIKRSKAQPFVPTSNNSNFYSNVPLEKDYCWRSFQLAFILLNIDAFVKPQKGDLTVPDVFGTGWPERNDIADLVWFPTGGGKTEAYLGIIAFTIALRRFSRGAQSNGTAALMRYTLRLLTLQQFQRATLLICALESIRKDLFPIPHGLSLGNERITIGLFVGSKSLPNTWEKMHEILDRISNQLKTLKDPSQIKTNLPYTECPWCGGNLFIDATLPNVSPYNGNYGKNDNMHIMCNTEGCSFYNKRPHEEKSLPFRLFDQDIYKSPPTLLFGTVDKFAALANKVSISASERDDDSRRLFGKGHQLNNYPPELIIQDELHLLLGPLGSAVGLYEKSIDELCSRTINGQLVKAKVITSTATTRNTDKQIFALFNRRSEIFPKQGIDCDDSFFAYYEREVINGVEKYISNRKYVGILPIGKTQVWMQLRIASIALTHRLKFLLSKCSLDTIFNDHTSYTDYKEVFDYYHTVLSYFNSLKEVGKTQSQLSHYLPGDVNLITKNTLPWTFTDRLLRSSAEIRASELTGRLQGEEVKTNLSHIEQTWEINNISNPPEFVISTNMISVGIDVSRFNTMIITSMPRNTAEYIQSSSRVARDKAGIVFTVHHPFRSRDISHYQRFKEFHEKFYSYVEPISVTPFAHKAIERYFAMFLSVIVRHNDTLDLRGNMEAGNIDEKKVDRIIKLVHEQIEIIRSNSIKLNSYLTTRINGPRLSMEGIIDDEELNDIRSYTSDLLIRRWLERVYSEDQKLSLNFRDENSIQSLFEPRKNPALNDNWNVKDSLREIAPSAVIKTVQQ